MMMKMRLFLSAATVVCMACIVDISLGFTTPGFLPRAGTAVSFVTKQQKITTSRFSLLASTDPEVSTTTATQSTTDDDFRNDGGESSAVRAPLKFLGPYPCLGLKFPNLATSKQRSNNMTGVSLDFVLDTAANTNTINGQVAQELDLSVVGAALPGLGAGGSIQGGSTYLLGDSELEGLPKEEESFTFMKELTASALPVANPAAAGLLSLAFFHCFEGGVEFQWGTTGSAPPSVTFHGEKSDVEPFLSNLTQVAIKELPVTKLPSVSIQINGVTMPALLDTGSPITVLNAQAAEQAGINPVEVPGVTENSNRGGNPLANFANKFKQAQAAAQAAGRGDILSIAGTTGERVDLLKSNSPVKLGVVANNDDDALVDFGSSNIYIGNLPGLAAMNALGDDSPPAAVLGMDVIRLRPRMLLRARDKEVYF